MKFPGMPPLLRIVQDAAAVTKEWKDWYTVLVRWLRYVIPPGGTTGQALVKASNADYHTQWATVGGGGGSGTVTSVALTMPSGFVVGGSPVTTTGTLAVTADTVAAHYVAVGPTSGGPAAWTFRALVASDIPPLPYIGGTVGTTDNRLTRADGTGGSTAQGSAVTVDDNGEIYGYAVKLNQQTGTTYTLAASDTGKVVECNNASAITVTLPNSLPVGFGCTLMQTGAGQVTFSAASGAAFVAYSSKTKCAGQYAAVTIWVDSNSGGSAATYRIAGTMA